MSDETTQASNSQTPDAGAGQTAATSDAGTQSSGTPDAGATQTAAATDAQPYRAFATEKDLQDFVKRSKSQAERAAVRKLASDLGFEDADELRDALEPLRKTPAKEPGTQGDAAQPAATPAGPSDADRLRMAINVGAKLNLPAALVGRLQGDTPEAMEADAQALVALMQAPARPGIPGAPQTEQRATFTRQQLSDPKFVREHQAEIMQASRDGRIVDS